MSSPVVPNSRLARCEAALKFLMNRIDYERTQSMPCSEEILKLNRMRELLARLGNPQDRMSIVHVAGTKGKGSTAAMIAAVLSAAGHRTGLFSSPHLDRVEERMAIDGHPCAADELAELVEWIRPHVEAMDQAAAQSASPESGPTYFEIITAIALEYFRIRQADVAVLEVGLGGRLDSTNVCSPCVSVITSISFDHTKQLGDTLAAIATEKAGIIKPGVPVVSGVEEEEPREVIRRIAQQNDCPIVELGVDFDFEYYPPRHLELEASSGRFDYVNLQPIVAGCSVVTAGGSKSVALELLGRHQAANAAVALATVEELREIGWRIPDGAIRRGLAGVVWPARVEVVARRPVVVLDAAHNVASIAALVETLDESFSVGRRLLIFATTQEKDHRGMLQQLVGRFDHIVFTQYTSNPRGVPPKELLALATEVAASLPTAQGEKLAVKAAQMQLTATPAEAWDVIRGLATPDDLVCITGSFFLASEMRAQIAAHPF